jgi:uncharacterized protein
MGASARALEIPESPRDYVYDGANLLSSNGRARLTNDLHQEDLRSGNQVLFASFPSLEGEDPVDFVNRLFKKWNPGLKGKNNGVVLAVFMREHKIRIEVGYGLEPILTDAATRRIIETLIKPRFKAGTFEAGILEGTGATLSLLRGETPAATNLNRKTSSQKKTQLGLVMILVMILSFFRFMDRSTSLGTRRRGYRDRGMSFGGFGSPGGFESSSSDNGGFSGGGGSSGGGGASGDW